MKQIRYSMVIIMIVLVGCMTPLIETDVLKTTTHIVYQDDSYLFYHIVDDIVEEVEEEIIEEAIQIPEVVASIQSQVVKTATTHTSEVVLGTYTGSMSGYGPDCYGCTSNRTAFGYYVGEGNIYYQDAIYGQVRIVSGDASFPFGTIVKITGSKVAPTIYAIVLDRGGSIGIGKTHLFDLLFANQKDALGYGVSYNTTFEILRLGY